MDFVRKMRVASLLTPFFALLCDNAPIYQGSRNSMCSVRTRIWQEGERAEAQYHEMELPCVCDGIYAAGFILFPGERLQY